MISKKKFFLHPGYIFVSKDHYLIHTVLGSCVSICLWDRLLKFGGMNHYIYSTPLHREKNGQYGSISIPYLIKLMDDRGSSNSNIRAHIVGGASNHLLGSDLVGKKNISIADNTLKQYGISVVTRDIGGEMGRKVIFDTETGEILVYKVSNIRADDWHEDNKGIDY